MADFGQMQTMFRAELRAGFTAVSPNAQFKITGAPDPSPPITTEEWDALLTTARAYLRLLGRHNLGVRELERDRRRG